MKHVSGATQALPHRPQFVLLVNGLWHPEPQNSVNGGLVHRGSRSPLNPSETSAEASGDASRVTSCGASAPASTGAKHMPPTHT